MCCLFKKYYYLCIRKQLEPHTQFIGVSNEGVHIPLFELIISAKYYSEIPEKIIDINDLVKIELYDGDTKVDASKYNIKLDVKTGLLKILNK